MTATDESIPLLPLVQQQQVQVNVANALAATSDTLANRPTPSALSGNFFYATDQNVLYLSTGAAWARIGDPAGATMAWYSTAAPTGWVAYDGANLPASTGIYADLFAHLGGLTTPDTQGRVVVIKGTNADVSTLGNTDGLADASRSPKHNVTNGLTLPNHVHSDTIDYQVATASGVGGDGTQNPPATLNNRTFTYWDQNQSSGDSGADPYLKRSGSVGNPTSNPAIGGTIGPGGSRPTDTPAFITFGLLIAKL